VQFLTKKMFLKKYFKTKAAFTLAMSCDQKRRFLEQKDAALGVTKCITINVMNQIALCAA
jgi:hypothetical protein